MTSQTVILHILVNISRSKGNQTMKFSQVIEYDKRNIFLQKSCRKWNRKTSYRLLLFKEAWYEVKASGLQLSFNMFWQSSTWHTIKTSYTLSSCMNIDPEICSILVFRKGSGNSISIAFCVWFKKKKISRATLY